MSDIDQQIRDYPSCKDRIEESLSGREEYVAQLFEAIESGEPFDGYDYPEDALFEFPLEITQKIVFKILLSTGGPADWLEVILHVEPNGANEIEMIEYHFQDWFDHAQTLVYPDSPLYQYAQNVVEALSL